MAYITEKPFIIPNPPHMAEIDKNTCGKTVLKYGFWKSFHEFLCRRGFVIFCKGGCTELISCATGLKLEFDAVTICASLLALTWWESVSIAWSGAIHLQRNCANNKLKIDLLMNFHFRCYIVYTLYYMILCGLSDFRFLSSIDPFWMKQLFYAWL